MGLNPSIVLLVFLNFTYLTTGKEETLLFKRVHGVIAIPVISEDIVFEDELSIHLVFELPEMHQYVNFTCDDGDLECELKKEFNSLNTGISQMYEDNLQTRRRRQILLLGALAVGYLGYEFGRSQNEDDISYLKATDKEIEDHVKQLEIRSQSQTKQIIMIEKDIRLMAIEEMKRDTQLAMGINHVQEEIATLFKLNLRTIDYLRFRNVVAACRLGFLPEELINLEFLVSLRKKAQNRIMNSSMELGISKKNLHLLFNRKIAQCIFGNSKLLVKLRLPLVKKKSVYKLFRIYNIPFQYNTQVCQIELNNIFAASIDNVVYPVRDSDCKTGSSGICKVGIGSPALSTECIHTVVHSGTLEDIKRSCSFTCSSSKNLIITRIDPFYYITNAANISVICANKSYVYNNVNNSLGAIELLLSNECTAEVDGKLIAPSWKSLSQGQYSFDHSIHVTIPGGWAKGLTNLGSDTPRYLNLSEVYDEQWVKKLSVFNKSEQNLTVQALPNWDDVSINHITSYVSNQEVKDLLVFSWLIILSCFVATLCYKMFLSCCGRRDYRQVEIPLGRL